MLRNELDQSTSKIDVYIISSDTFFFNQDKEVHINRAVKVLINWETASELGCESAYKLGK